MISMSLVTFSFVVFVTVITPGPTVLLALTNGSRVGLRRAGYGAAGAAVSDIALISATALGLGAVLATSAFWFAVVKWAGVAYLGWLGLRMLRSSGSLYSQSHEALSIQRDDADSRCRLFLKSFLVAITNPKGYLFFAAFLPQFVDISAPLAPQYMTLAVLFVLIDLAVMTVYAALGERAVQVLRHRGTLWVDRTCGVVLLALAGTLASYHRA